MQQEHTATSHGVHPSIPRPAASHDAAMLAAKVEALTTQVAYLVERQKKQEELFAEMMPIAKEVLGTATSRLDDLEKRGYFAFGREALRVGERIVEGFGPRDVEALGDAIVSILETVRAVTQPDVLSTITEAANVIEGADRVQPLGLVGMVRASGDDEVQKGMAVMVEVLRHVGRASRTFAAKRAGSPAEQRRQKLAEALGPRRKKALGTEREPVRPSARVARAAPAAAAPVAAPAAPKAAAVIDGVAFGSDGHLADPNVWTMDLASRLAAVEGLELTAERVRIIELARAEFTATGASPNIRKLTQVGAIATKELYALFPKAPARTIAKIAGIPKPAGCL